MVLSEIDRRNNGCADNLLEPDIVRQFHRLRGFLHRLQVSKSKEWTDHVGGLFIAWCNSAGAGTLTQLA